VPGMSVERSDLNSDDSPFFNQGKTVAAYAGEYFSQDEPLSRSSYFFLMRLALVMDALPPAQGGTVLDVGCGPGPYALYCVAKGYRYHGVDISDKMIDEARQRFGVLKDAEFSVSDARRLPFPSDSIDVVLCLGVLEYVPPELEADYLREIARVLKPGGRVIFSFLNRNCPYWLFEDYLFPILRLGLRSLQAALKNTRFRFRRDFSRTPPYTRKFTLRGMTACLASLGFLVTDTKYFAPNIFPPRLNEGPGSILVDMMSTLEPMMGNPLVGWLGQAFLIIAQLR